ncbi:MAG: D-arabinose 5-phosphate isomerase [Acidobacteria bacterium]|nr:MAG: D-arabinose 5-phosphate isomerase [Acidobacteriota bacterium]
MVLDRARRVLITEADAIRQVASSLDEHFIDVVNCIVSTQGRIVLTGMGKSGIICRKIAATLASTGTPAFFLHPAEAIHGDLGMVIPNDTVIAISNSGETEELVRMMEYIKRQGATLISITGNPKSTLSTYADLPLHYEINEEGCPLGLAPMASTTTSLAMGDALAAAVMEKRGFSPQDFARFHPGGKLGSKLLLVKDVMHQGQKKPQVEAKTPLSEALIEMSQKRLGMTAVKLPNGKWGFLSDGDIRRMLQKHGPDALQLTAEKACSKNSKRIQPDCLAAEALKIMESHQITSLLVMNLQGEYVGVVHLHDLWNTHLV